MGRDGRVPQDKTAEFELPPAGTMRWVPRRKAQVVAAVRSGGLSLDEACKRYELTVEEFLSWQRAIDKFGLPGLRVSHAHRSGVQLSA